ncbi:hypothetical protein GCM10027592_11550 [Spirosoma flavus]
MVVARNNNATMRQRKRPEVVGVSKTITDKLGRKEDLAAYLPEKERWMSDEQ